MDSPDHETALRIAFESSAGNPALTEITIDFDQHTAAALEAAHDPRAQLRPEEAEGPLLAFAYDVLRKRVSDPARKAHEGDARDLLHLMHASMTDAALLDRSHAALARSSKHRAFWVGSKPGDLLTHIRERLPA